MTKSRTGDTLDAAARITFDVNPPIETPLYQNTIDADAPTSEVIRVAPTSDASHVFRSNLDEA
ncbi:MAG: hypothetical protein R3C05_28190 [Pirellulaceae bacterium]